MKSIFIKTKVSSWGKYKPRSPEGSQLGFLNVGFEAFLAGVGAGSDDFDEFPSL
jgi:hypothetical protein